MHSNGPPRLHINPPYYQQQQQAPTSAHYFSSPATYSPLPFAQQTFNSGENGVRGFFPAGRQDGANVGYAGIPMNGVTMTGAPMMGLGLSQISEAPSMLRSSSSSSYSSSSSFVPSTPNTFGAYFSPPLQQSSPTLFSPPLPASPSFSSNSIRPIPPRTKLHAHAPSFHIPTSSPPARHSNKNLSISIRGGNPFPQRHSRNESTFKATTPLGIGTRPDEEVKKKKKVLVRIPKEREKEDGVEDDRKQSKFCRVPLGSDDKLRIMGEMERDLREGAIMLEEDEIVGKLCHYDEQKSPSLPSTIEVYLPGLAGWEVAWEEFGEESHASFGSFDVPKPAFLEPTSPALPRSGLSSPAGAFSPSTPLHAPPIPPPPSSQRSHTRTFSLFDSPVALPARLQNVLDSLSGRRASHSSSMSLSSPKMDQLNPAATPFTTSRPSSQSKLTPFAPAFTLPSWAAIKAKAQGVPLPDTDESMEEGIEGDDNSPNDTIEASREMVESPVAMEEDVLAREEAEELGRAVDTKMEEGNDDEGPTRKLSGVSTRTDHTGIASISDGFVDKDGSHAGDEGGRDILAGSPDASNGHLDNSPPNRPPSSLGDEISRALSDLGPLDTTAGSPNNDSSNQRLSVNINSASKEEASEGDHKVNKSFEFPLRSPAVSPEKPRPAQLSPSRETLDSAPIETAMNLSSDIPTTLAFRQAGDSIQNSPTLFGMNGAPGPLATSSPRNDSPLPSSPHPSITHSTENLTVDDLEPIHALRPLSDCDGLYDDTKSNSTSASPAVPLVRPTPRRPHLDPRNDSPLTAPAPFPFTSSSNLASTSSPHNFDFRLPSHAPQLPSHQQSESPRKVSRPLPPIPLLAVTSSHDSATKRQKIETPQTAHDVIRPPSFYRAVSTPNISARRPLPTPPADYRPRTPSNYRASYDFGSLSLASLDDAIPEQYSPKQSNLRNPDNRPLELRAMASFSSDGRILRFNGGTSSKIRSPLPTFSTPGSSINAGSGNQRGRQESTDINLPTTSRSKSRAVAISSGTVDALDERHSAETNSSRDSSRDSSVVELSEEGSVDEGEDDMPLRILEGIIERQFDGLRAELKKAASTLQQDSLVDAVASRLEGLLAPLASGTRGQSRPLSLSTQQLGLPPPHSILRPTTPALHDHPAAAYSAFLDDLRTTVLPLVQAPIDTHALTTEITVQLQQGLARHSEEMLKAVSTRRESSSSPSLKEFNQVAAKQEALAEAVKDLSSNFSRLAQDVDVSQAASTNLKSTMGQLSLDVTSRLDLAYSALDTLLQEHLAKLPSPDHLARINNLEAQLAKARSDHGAVRSEKAVLEERLENEKTRHNDEAARLRSDLLSAQATIKKLGEEKLGSTTKSARLEGDFENSQQNLQDLKRSLIARDERLEAVESEKSKLTIELGESRVQIKQLSHERDQLCREKDALVHQYSKRPRPSPPTFDHARLDSTESDPDLSSTPPSRPKCTSSFCPATPTKLVPQLTGGSDDSDDTIAHTDVSPSPSVLGRSYVLSDDGWYSEA